MAGKLATPLGQYSLITANYWAFTLTDGALRMLILLHFYQLGFTPIAIAMLFIFYEIFGVATNLVGGWLGARLGLNRTMNTGLGLQIIALLMLLVPSQYLLVTWVMAAQALSGIAKDLNKMSAKSAIKSFIPKEQDTRLFRWVALLTGSKNALKGLGFFIGGVLLTQFGFTGAVLIMTALLVVILGFSLFKLQPDLGKAKGKVKFSQVLSNSRAVNILSCARLFLFCARDVWFVIALPVYLSSTLQWSHSQVGGFLACWIIGYGIIQASAPKLGFKRFLNYATNVLAFRWALALTAIPLILVIGLSITHNDTYIILLAGLTCFAIVFALNSALHSYLIVHFAKQDGASLDIGFYYMCNALGRLMGTLLSGLLYQSQGLLACLIASTLFLGLTSVISVYLPDARNSEHLPQGL